MDTLADIDALFWHVEMNGQLVRIICAAPKPARRIDKPAAFPYYSPAGWFRRRWQPRARLEASNNQSAIYLPKTRDMKDNSRHHQQTEEALRNSESHYRLLFENNPTPVYVYDETTLGFLAVNKAAVLHYGYSREEFLSLTLKDIALPEEIPAFMQKLSQLPSGAGSSGIWRHRKKDGKLSEMEITSHSLILEGRKAWLSLAMDVTERLSLEAQLRQSQKMESVGQLAGGIAHDFNNLLTVINGHSGILLTMDNLSPQIAESLREISEAAQRAADLTRQLLTFSRKQVIQLQVVDLNEVVNNVGKMLRRILGEDIALEVNFSPSLPSVKADLGMIEQILLNLAVNSRDAMPAGGKLRIDTSSVMIDEAQAQHNPEASTGRFVCLTFADTGCGISPGKPAAHLRAVFHHQGIGPRNRPGPRHGLRHHQTAPGLDPGRQPVGRRNHLPNLSPRLR